MKSLVAIVGAVVCVLMVGPKALAQDVNLYAIPNQSAHFIRMPSREASTEIDAVYFNPAGLIELPEGFHLSINNQVLRQYSKVTSDYVHLNDVPTSYEGVASSFIFPSVYGAYRKGRIAGSFGILMVGGAGGAAYDNLPTPDAGIADVIPLIQFQPLNLIDDYVKTQTGQNPRYSALEGYRFDFYSNGYGFSPGIQAGFSYQATKNIGVAFGARFVQQYLEAKSALTNIQVYHGEYGGWQDPSEYLDMVADDPNLDDLRRSFVAAVATGLEQDLTDVQVDVTQYGYGLTPIFGISIRATDFINIGMRYEHNTAITMETSVKDGADGAGTFVDGERFRSDIPGFLSVGVRYDVFPRLNAHVGMRYMFDKSTDWNGRDSLVEGNYYELAIAGEYQLSDRILLSCGYTYNQPRVAPQYQNEADFRIPGHTGAIGGAYDFSEKLRLNLGVMYSLFDSERHNYPHAVGGNENNLLDNNLTFEKRALVIGMGVDMKFDRRN